jgi:anti-anti-sigma factor
MGLTVVVENPFEIKVRRGGRSVVVEVSGELDRRSAPQLEAELESVWRSGETGVIVDLRGVQFMDSTGLRTIVRARQRAQRSRQRFAVVDGPDQVHGLLRRTGVLAMLTVLGAPDELPG